MPHVRVELGFHNGISDRLRITAAREHADQPTDLLVTFQIGRNGAQLAAHHCGGPGMLVIGTDGVQSRDGDLARHTFTAQFIGQSLLTLARVGVPGLHPLHGEIGVVDQPDLGESIESTFGDIFGKTLVRESFAQFRPAARTDREQPPTCFFRLFGGAAFGSIGSPCAVRFGIRRSRDCRNTAFAGGIDKFRQPTARLGYRVDSLLLRGSRTPAGYRLRNRQAPRRRSWSHRRRYPISP